MIKARRFAFMAKRQAEWQEFELPEQSRPNKVLIRTLWSAISAGTVALFGAGLIGQFATQFAQLDGRFPVVSIGRLTGRLEQARACGISRVLDVVVEATGAASVVAQALALAAVYGRVVLLDWRKETA